MRHQRGQATTEYIAIVAVVGVVFLGAGTAIAAPGIPRAVVHGIRVGLCIVTGNVCTAADARARGLEPCVRSEEARDVENAFGAVVGWHARHHWSVRGTSDGRWTLSVSNGNGPTLSDSTGAKLGPVRAMVDGTARVDFASGREWTLPEPRLRALLRQVRHPTDLADPDVARRYHLPPPTRTFDDRSVGGEAGASIGVQLRGVDLDLVDATASTALGRRSGGGPPVWYFRLTDGLSSALPLAGGISGGGVAEYREGSPPVLAVRETTPAGEGVEVEREVTWPLRDQIAAGLARRALRSVVSSADRRALAARFRREAVTEERRYRTTVLEDDGLALQLGGVGVSHEARTVRRQLVDARVTGPGYAGRRHDCVGLDAGRRGAVGTPR